MTKQQTLLKQGDKHLNKPNFMINFERPKNLVSNKIYNHFLWIVLSEYDFTDTEGNQDNRFYTTIDEIKTKCNLSKKSSNYDFIYDSIRELKKHEIRVVEYYDKPDKPDVQKIKRLSEFNLISGWSGYVEDGFIYFEMPNMLLDHLRTLKEQRQLIYTRLNNDFLNSFKHSHSLALYELLKEHEKAFKMKKSFSDLKELLGIEPTKYEKPRDFRRFVIEKAFDEILKTTDLNFSYDIKRERNGRGFEHYLMVSFGKSNHLTLTTFKKAFLHVAKTREDLGFKAEGLELAINAKGFLVNYDTGRSIDNEVAMKVWHHIFTNYGKKPENTLKVLNIGAADFDEVLNFYKNGGAI